MARMIRKQVYIEERQEAALKEAARRLGTTEAELVRRAIQLLDRAAVLPVLDDRAWEEELAFMDERAKLTAPRPERPLRRGAADLEAWETALAVMRRRASLARPETKPPKDRGWTREELYDERITRLSR
jgi:hypothetical protein